MKITRRQFIQSSLAALTNTIIVPKVFSATTNIQKTLYIHNIHTNEHFKGIFMQNGFYDPKALKALQYLLRDRRNQQQHPINLRLYDMMHRLQQLFDTNRPFELISGYRSQQSNAQMHCQSTGVARNSLHMIGYAIDIALPGIKLHKLRDAVRSLKAGGVGYYPTSGFVHMDIRKRPVFW